MRARALLPLATITAVAALALPSPASPAAQTTQICGQLNGPHASWTLTLPGRKPIKLTGNRWTVFLTGTMPCAKAVKVVPGLLKQWAKTSNQNLIKPGLTGYFCSRDSSGGQGACLKGTSLNITFIMTGPYTIAQIRQLGVS